MVAGSVASGAAGFDARLGPGFAAGFFAPDSGAARGQGLSMTDLVAAGGAGRHGSFVGGLGIVGGGVGFGGGGVIFGDGFRGFGRHLFPAHRHQEVSFGTFAQAQVFFAGQLGNRGTFLVLGLYTTGPQEQRKEDN